ncbi:hypothetical protein Q9Q95_07075 [Sphingomonas sp. DG1-23]|uniref:hypothetical protein n=1 Tax=Sphingomonas sp. DG1-23 TaxID=3068316 RepID=UPI00273D8324|nr:hypothetical protein [Sphingomonas sp. DG1-23]MDP5278681.1 hypothetical protein [Sphingomonas sp. DG1-23]
MKIGSESREMQSDFEEAGQSLLPLSAWLLGFPESSSTMFANRRELAETLLRRLLADGRGAPLQELQDRFHAARKVDAAEVLATLGCAARSVAQTIMAAWLLGRYLPFETEDCTGSVQAGVMGAEAYRQSLVWHLIGATPMGVPQGGPNSWALPPRNMV